MSVHPSNQLINLVKDCHLFEMYCLFFLLFLWGQSIQLSFCRATHLMPQMTKDGPHYLKHFYFNLDLLRIFSVTALLGLADLNQSSRPIFFQVFLSLCDGWCVGCFVWISTHVYLPFVFIFSVFSTLLWCFFLFCHRISGSPRAPATALKAGLQITRGSHQEKNVHYQFNKGCIFQYGNTG